MGNNLFGVNISGIINKELGKHVLAATLTSYVRGSRTSGSLTSGKEKTPSTHTCRGFVSSYKDSEVDGTIVRKGDRKITLLGDSISPAAVPKSKWKITIEGSTFEIINVDRDPDAATYTCQGR